MKVLNMKLFLIVLSSVLLFSCSKTLDINTDPNTATTVSPDLLFNYALTSWSAKRQDGDSYIPFSFLVQNQASGGNAGWGKTDVYDINPFSIRNVWRGYYAYSGKNLMLAIEQAQAAVPANNNAAAQSRILLANMMYECTTIWGDIPFSEAWNADISYPKFDSQKDVFEGIIRLLDQSVAQIDVDGNKKISGYDILYHGDMAKWKKFANSLKFKVLMTMVDKDPSKAGAISALVGGGEMISSADENVLYPYLNVPGKENPKYRILSTYTGGYNFFFYCSNNVFKYMSPYNDPRIPVYFEKGYAATEFVPIESEEDANENTATINTTTLFKADAPDIIFSLQEQLFFEAEVYARGIGVPVNLTKANELYKSGITAAMQFYGISESDINTYLTAVPSLTAATDPVKEIHMQQWIDLQDRPLEAFTQWRRSGSEGNEFPDLQIPPGATNGGLMRRWVYPQSAEIVPNVNAPKTVPAITDKLWFDL